MNRMMIQDIVVNKTNRFEPRHEETNSDDDGSRKSTASRFKKKALGLIFLTTLGLLFWFGSAFTQVNLKITPRQELVRLDDTFTAERKAGANGIRYEIMKVEEEAVVTVAAVGVKKVDKKATGKIIVYNSFGPQTQKFIAGTRFEAKSGKIYKIENAITIPGSRFLDGSLVPGSVEATVKAAESGVEYNVDLTDFTVPGLKGSPRYNKFYARSKTAIEGGFKGEMKIAKESDLQAARAKLDTLLKEKVVASAKSKLPDDFIFYPDGQYFSFKEDQGSDSIATSTLEIKARAKMESVILDKKDLGLAIAKRRVSGFSGEDVEARDLESLTFNLVNKNKFDLEKDTQVVFRLKGETKLTWKFDQLALARKLVGLPKKDYQAALGDFTSIDRAEAVFRPFWVRAFPSDQKRIKIELLDLP